MLMLSSYQHIKGYLIISIEIYFQCSIIKWDMF